MGLIKEPLDVDFYVDPRPMTKEDEKAISDYIKADKLKRSKKAGRSISANMGGSCTTSFIKRSNQV
jgi:hypothetical protein